VQQQLILVTKLELHKIVAMLLASQNAAEGVSWETSQNVAIHIVDAFLGSDACAAVSPWVSEGLQRNRHHRAISAVSMLMVLG